MDKKIQVTLIRHGSTINSESDKYIFLGSQNNPDLSPAGVLGVKTLSQKLDTKITKIFCSNLNRSIQTAKIIADEIRQKRGGEIPIIVLPEIREIDLGLFSGKTRQEIEKSFPENANEFFSNQIVKWSFPEGENYTAITKRLEIFKKQLSSQTKDGEHVLIVGHGLINRVFLSEMPDILNKNNLTLDVYYPYDKIINFDLSLRE